MSTKPLPEVTPPATRNRYVSATSGLQVFVLMCDHGCVGRIVLRRRQTAQGHIVRAFVHVFGYPMAEGSASGGGYDIASAALQAALRKGRDAHPPHVRARFSAVYEKLESQSITAALRALTGDWYAVEAV